MTTQIRFTARPFAGEADLPPILDLFNRSAVEKQYEQTDLDGLRHWFSSPNVDQARDLRLWEDAAGRLVGFATLWVPLPDDNEFFEGRINLFIQPDARGQGLESDMIAWGTEQLRGIGQERNRPVRVFLDAPEHDTRERAMIEAHGFTVVRYFFVMHRSLAEPIPEPEFPGYTLRHMSRDLADVERSVELYNLSFIDHWGFHPLILDDR